ncbi:molybdopterin-guanine dinucleotide biosynthesis protein B [Candidatus Bathyarchaeota archaeon]|nr:molybdopterin-guanine dinucleotide biosynthesis protein B [Candidatus Bathyarchaeota archaeon]
MTKIQIIAVLGKKHAGKTNTIEALIRGLTKDGYKVGTVKHIPHSRFTIDVEGKDTWRHAKAGAEIVVSVAPREVAVIEKVDSSKYGLNEIVKNFVGRVEIVILEGFKELVKIDENIPKVIAIKTREEAVEALRDYKPIWAFTGPIKEKPASLEIPYIDIINEPDKLVDLVESRLKALIKIARIEDQLPGFNCGNCGYKTCYELARAIAENKAKLADCNMLKSAGNTLVIKDNNHVLPINPFVQKIIRKAVLAMISTLKGITIKGNEAVIISVKETKTSNPIRLDQG